MLCTKPFKAIHSFFKQDEYGAAAATGVAIAASVSCPIIPVAAGAGLTTLAAVDATVATGKGLVWTAKKLLAYRRKRKADKEWQAYLNRPPEPKPDPAEEALKRILSIQQKYDQLVTLAESFRDPLQRSMALAQADRWLRQRLAEEGGKEFTRNELIIRPANEDAIASAFPPEEH